MYADGLNIRHLKISFTKLMEWGKAHADKQPKHQYLKKPTQWGWTNSTPSWIRKKNRIYILTFVDQATRCILAW
jgi:hypothetical protein